MTTERSPERAQWLDDEEMRAWRGLVEAYADLQAALEADLVSGFALITRMKPRVAGTRRLVHVRTIRRAPVRDANAAGDPGASIYRHSTRGSRSPYRTSAMRFARTTPIAKMMTTPMVPANS